MMSDSVQARQDQRTSVRVSLGTIVGPGISCVAKPDGVGFARTIQLWIQLEISCHKVLNLYQRRFAVLSHLIGSQLLHEARQDSSISTTNLLLSHIIRIQGENLY